MSKLFSFLLISILVTSLFIGLNKAYGDELDEINKQIEELTKALDQSKAATTPLEDQVQSIRGRIAYIESDVVQKEKDIQKSYADLGKQTDELNLAIRNYYIKSYYNSPLLIFLSGNDASTITQMLAFQKATADQDKELITKIAITINDLEKRKENLEAEKIKLASTKANLDKIIGEAKDYQDTLGKEIASLTKKQQEIMAARSGNFTFSMGDGELADEYLSSIKGFRESAPAGYFAIFSFGAYTHRNGMSQYGARGRAQSGQNYQSILSSYYPGSNLETKGDLPGEINVRGFGNMPFEDRYLLGIAEMPSSWHPEALKAQAIAARTYAYRNKDMDGGICTDEGCQVFLSSKADDPPQAWRDAVQSTRGQILTKDGQPVSTQYASTHGGYTNNIGWDTTDGGGGGSFIDKAYDKIGGSPWLYKSWWRQGYSNSSDTCGRANPWLSPEEMADIVNAAIALSDSGGIDTSKITPVTTSCWGGEPYSMSELRNLTANKGGLSSASSVTVTQGNGTTTNVTVNGISMSGNAFKKAVCLRAPGYIRIPQSTCEGGWSFFNIEKK